MTVKDIKLKYCVGVLPINMVFANNVEENTKRLNDAYDYKGQEEIVNEKGGNVSACTILCNGDSIKKNLTPEERVSKEFKNVITESEIVKYRCSNSLIETKNNEVKVTDELLKTIKDEVKDRCILTEIQIGDQYLYFFTKEGLTIRYFVDIKKCNNFKDIISKNFKDILKNRNQFKVTVEDDKVIIESQKESNGLGFMNDFNNLDDNERKRLSNNESLGENPAVYTDNSYDMMRKDKKESDDKNLDNEDNGIMSEKDDCRSKINSDDINPENTCFNSNNPADTGIEMAGSGSKNPYDNSNNSERAGRESGNSLDNNDFKAGSCGSGDYSDSGITYGITEKC